ncbi:unnamed protein product [Closterium sp. NIES-54]
MDTDRQAARKVDWLGPSFDTSLYSSRRLFATAADGTQVATNLVKHVLSVSPSPPISPLQVSPSFDPSLYSSRRHFATAADGTQVATNLFKHVLSVSPSPHLTIPHLPLSLPCRSVLSRLSFSSNRLSLLDRGVAVAIAHVRGGGDWGSIDGSITSIPLSCPSSHSPPQVPSRLSFSPDRLSLLDRGMAVAIAHVRGGGDWDYQWYLDGKLLRKRNTVWDVIACAEHLIKEGLTTPDRLALEGRSAGGIPVGAAVNERPDLFRSAVAGVPFVDVLSTMLDASLHLTITEWEVGWASELAQECGVPFVDVLSTMLDASLHLTITEWEVGSVSLGGGWVG